MLSKRSLRDSKIMNTTTTTRLLVLLRTTGGLTLESRQFHLGLFATEPLNKDLQLPSFPSSITGTSYTHGRMDGCRLRTCMDMEECNLHARKKSQKRKPKTREKIAARLCIHSCIMCSFCWGLIVLDDIAAGYTHTPYSILLVSTEYGRGFLAIHLSVPRGMQHGPDHGSWMCLPSKVRSTRCQCLC